MVDFYYITTTSGLFGAKHQRTAFGGYRSPFAYMLCFLVQVCFGESGLIDTKSLKVQSHHSNKKAPTVWLMLFFASYTDLDVDTKQFGKL
jgi:hypothetical protein